MRIAGGQAKGLTLKVPKINGIRPAQEMVRLAIFSILGDDIQGKKVLDLYAGSGSYGLEALSRGATQVTFVDNHPQSAKIIEKNAANAQLLDRSEIIRHDALRYLIDCEETFDLIFADPPYAYGMPKPLLYQIADHLAPSGLLILDHDKTTTFNKKLDLLTIIDHRSYGATALTIFQRD